MRRSTRQGLAVALALALAAGASAAHAQLVQREAMEVDGRKLAVSGAEESAILAINDALRRGREAQDAALAAARKVVRTPDGRYVFAVYELEVARIQRSDGLKAEALDILIASGRTPPPKLASYLAARGQIAFVRKDYETADRHWTQLLEMRPADPDALSNLAQVKQARGDAKGAADLLARAMAARRTSGKPPPESWYRQRLSVAFNGGLAGPGIAAAQELVTAYPSPQNWRDAIVAYRQLAAPSGALEIDLFRFTRAVGALAREAEYQRMAQLLLHDGAAAEAKSVLDEGRARGLLSAATSPTREIIEEVDRALAKEPAPARMPADAAALNVRKGASLFLAGRSVEAEAAFRLAASSPGGYADLARFWLIRLAQAAPPAS